MTKSATPSDIYSCAAYPKCGCVGECHRPASRSDEEGARIIAAFNALKDCDYCYRAGPWSSCVHFRELMTAIRSERGPLALPLKWDRERDCHLDANGTPISEWQIAAAINTMGGFK